MKLAPDVRIFIYFKLLYKFSILPTEDKAPPIITYCPANITQQVTSVTQQGLFITWNLPEAFDLSNQNVTIVPANESQPMPGSFFSVRSTSVIQYNISDVLNNTAFCSFTVTVRKFAFLIGL